MAEQRAPARRCARSTLPDLEQRLRAVRIQRQHTGDRARPDRSPLDPHRGADVVVPRAAEWYDVSLGEPAGVHEHDLVAGLAVEAEDALQDSERPRVDERRSELLGHFADDRVERSLTELDAAADQSVEGPAVAGVLAAQNRVVGA